MEQNFIATCIEDYFFTKYEWNFKSGETSDGQQFFDVLSDESFEDLQNIAESYNKEVGKDLLHVALIRRKNGARRWEVEEHRLWDAIDAKSLKWSWIYGVNEMSEAVAVAYNELDEDEEGWKDAAEDYTGEEKEAFLKMVSACFDKARTYMNENKVLVRYGLDPDNWEILDRYPTSWSAKDADYMVVLLVSSDFNEDKIEDLEDLACYLNGCWTEGGNDPCNFISEWCDHNSCIYTEDDDTYEFAGKDFAYSEFDEELLTLADDGSFIVVDHKAELKDK